MSGGQGNEEKYERWLELLLEEAGPDRRARVDTPLSSDDEAPEFAALAGFLGEVRAEYAQRDSEWSGIEEGALVGRILARTTGEDLTWRGELALLAGFVHDRLGASRVLRLVAASLVLHLAALPALAWYLYREEGERPLFLTGIESPIEKPIENSLPEVQGEDDEVHFPTPRDRTVGDRAVGDRDPFAADAIENAIRRARFVLGTRRGPDLPAAVEGDSLERKWLIRRTRFLANRSWEPAWDEPEEEAVALRRGGRLSRILRAELLLDRFVLLGEHYPHLVELLSDLEQALHENVPAERPLVDALLDRARAYGLWPWTPAFEPLDVPVPLGAEWFEVLERAARGGALAGLLGHEQLGGWIGP